MKYNAIRLAVVETGHILESASFLFSWNGASNPIYFDFQQSQEKKKKLFLLFFFILHYDETYKIFWMSLLVSYEKI